MKIENADGKKMTAPRFFRLMRLPFSPRISLPLSYFCATMGAC
jgi:hypothetical protein